MIKRKLTTVILLLALALSLTGCKGKTDAVSVTESATVSSVSTSVSENEAYVVSEEASAKETPADEPKTEYKRNSFDADWYKEVDEELVLRDYYVQLFTLMNAGLDDFDTSKPYAEINNNKPFFDEIDFKEALEYEGFETYSSLDSYSRCGVAFACVGKETIPTGERLPIGQIKPSGWVQNKYPEIIKDNYLYNRCHLIAYCLAGENDNIKNLITGTRYMNTEGMLPFEVKVAEYMDKNPDNHVLYRATPVFRGNDEINKEEDCNLLAYGVLLEAYSVEDDGALSFCVYCFNVQPGIVIDYRTGDNHAK